MWTGATLGCNCRIKAKNYSVKKRADGQNLPANSFEKKPPNRSMTNKAFKLDRSCSKGEDEAENYC
jgi:hypothetical protein